MYFSLNKMKLQAAGNAPFATDHQEAYVKVIMQGKIKPLSDAKSYAKRFGLIVFCK